MSDLNSKSHIAGRRAELMAELFLQEFDPVFLSRPTSPKVGYDLLAGFRNAKAGINSFAVQVQPTERAPGKFARVPRSVFNHFAFSNVPGLLIVADVKQNKLYYGWLNVESAHSSTQSVKVPIAEVDRRARTTLTQEFQKSEHAVGATG